MPGEELATAAILSPTPLAARALFAFGLTLTAAPTSPKADAASYTSACIPKAAIACAAANHASPPPTMMMGRFWLIQQLLGHSSGAPPGLDNHTHALLLA